MPLPQEIRPLNQDLQDLLFKASGADWVENAPGMAWTRILWTGSETGTWAAIFRWKKGFVAPPHKHLSASHTYIIYGKLRVRAPPAPVTTATFPSRRALTSGRRN